MLTHIHVKKNVSPGHENHTVNPQVLTTTNLRIATYRSIVVPRKITHIVMYLKLLCLYDKEASAMLIPHKKDTHCTE